MHVGSAVLQAHDSTGHADDAAVSAGEGGAARLRGGGGGDRASARGCCSAPRRSVYEVLDLLAVLAHKYFASTKVCISHQRSRQQQRSKPLPCLRGTRVTKFTRFTSTKVRILTLKALDSGAFSATPRRFTCFTSTKIQILTLNARLLDSGAVFRDPASGFCSADVREVKRYVC